MTLRKRAGGIWHYVFKVNGSVYSGSTGKRVKSDAVKVEDKHKRRVQECSSLDRLHESIQSDLADGARISLEEAWGCFSHQPKKRKACVSRQKMDRSRWLDFEAYMASKYPEVEFMHQVMPAHAKAYSSYTENNGRWIKAVKATGKNLSPATLNDMRRLCRSVFENLKEDAGVSINPFKDIPRIDSEVFSYEAFSQEELKVIGSKADEDMYHLFMVGMCTGLREGDICMLRWTDIDWDKRCIKVTPSKTKRKQVQVTIPMMVGGFFDYMYGLSQNGSEYVNKVWAKRYSSESTRSGIGKQVRRFLQEECEIETDRRVADRSRKVKVKGVHSLRHTFCYLAAINGIPLNIVQGIVGHLTDKMTKHYMDHASMEAKESMLSKLPNYLISESSGETEVDPVRDIMSRIEKLSAENRKRLSVLMRV